MRIKIITICLCLLAPSVYVALIAQEASGQQENTTVSNEPAPKPPSAIAAIPAKPAAEPSNTSEEKPDPLAQTSALEVVVIASKGMSEALGKMSKIESVREALKNSMKFIPEDTHVGLRLSAHRIGAEDAKRSCQDSELLLAPAAKQQDQLINKMASAQTRGRRSIVQSLSRALADLAPYGGTKTLVLITDGKEECIEQDPVAYLAPESLKNRGYIIHIRGIGMDQEAAESLKNLAHATGGTFATADDPFSFTQQITIAVQRGAKPVTPPVVASEEAPLPLPAPVPEQIAKPIAPPPAPKPPAFDPNELIQKFVHEIIKALPKPEKIVIEKPAPPVPPPPPTPIFSKIALIIIGIETLLLILALGAVMLLILRQSRYE